MSKESRRAARAARESRRLGAAGAGRPTADAGTTSSSPTAGASTGPGAAGAAGTRRPAGAGARAGRRERVRRYQEPTFLERYRGLLIGVAAIAVLAVVVGIVFIGTTQPVFACTNTFDPSPTPSVSPGSSIRLGFPEDDMGRSHVVSRPQTYLFCPPASGNHISASGKGPIAPRVYKPGDDVGPPNWIHNLEHGGLVVLYRGDSPGATADGLKAFQDFYNSFPASPICKIPAYQVSPVIAKFDPMPHPYALLVWGRVMYLDTWDPALALRYYNEEDERLDKDGVLIQPPEDIFQCNAALHSSPSPSGSTEPSTAPSDASSAPPSAAPSAAASAASPEPSPSAS